MSEKPIVQSNRNPFHDVSTWILVASNFLVLVLAIKEGWSLLAMMWIYWGQSVIIGIFNFIRILSLKEFSTEKLTMNKKPIPTSAKGKIQVAFFFLFHYGFFHVAYAVFLAHSTKSANKFSNLLGSGIENWPIVEFSSWLLIGIVIFFFNHLFSFFYNRKLDSQRKPNIGRLMCFPYARIMPMHITILAISKTGLGPYSLAPLVTFIIFKTIADVSMHIVEHQQKIK